MGCYGALRRLRCVDTRARCREKMCLHQGSTMTRSGECCGGSSEISMSRRCAVWCICTRVSTSSMQRLPATSAQFDFVHCNGVHFPIVWLSVVFLPFKTVYTRRSLRESESELVTSVLHTDLLCSTFEEHVNVFTCSICACSYMCIFIGYDGTTYNHKISCA